MRDLLNKLKLLVALNGATISSSTTTAGAIIDTAGFDSLLFEIFSGARTDGTYTPLVEDGDDSGLSDAAAVDDKYLIGTEAGAVITGANKRAKVGYIGPKRYVRLSIVSTVVTTGAYLGATAILGNPATAPQSTQVN